MKEKEKKFYWSIQKAIDYLKNLKYRVNKDELDTLITADRLVWYEQSAWKAYHEHLNGLHNDPERMLVIFNQISQYIDKNLDKEEILICDFWWWNWNLLNFIKSKIETQEKYKNIKIKFIVVDWNKNQLENLPEGIDWRNEDITQKVNEKNIDIAISRNVFHYLSKDQQLKTIKNIKWALLEGWIFINAFVSTSLEWQKYMNTFWSNFATTCNIKKVKTKRYFSTPEEMNRYFQEAGFSKQYYFLWFHNTWIISWEGWFSEKYPSLTEKEINCFEQQLLRFPEDIKKELDIKKVPKTVSISQPVYIIVWKK